MEFADVVRRRRMVRRFRPDPVDPAALDRILDAGRRAPSAGHSQGWAFVVLEGAEQTRRYWDITLPAEEREDFTYASLVQAPVLVIPLAHARTYLERYSEADKTEAGLGSSVAAWPVPYWTVDTSFASMLMLLAAVDEGLGALFFGIFQNQAELLDALGVPAGFDPIGTIAIGHPAADDIPSGSSTTRARRPLADVVHRGGWS